MNVSAAAFPIAVNNVPSPAAAATFSTADAASRDIAARESAAPESSPGTGTRTGAENSGRPGAGERSESQTIGGLTEQEQSQVRELAARDREVRAHEQAHANVGGAYAGAPSYSYQRGPDGRQYAVGGEVSIDVSPIPGDPEATIAKARIVRRAALAPAEPSAQDRSVAAEATALEHQARAELLAESVAGAGQRAEADAPADSTTLFYAEIDVRV